jgi:hypothetical protein
MPPVLDSDSSPPAAPTEAKFGPQPAPDDPRIFKGSPAEFFKRAADDVVVLLQDEGAARRELGEAVLDELTADRQLHALELRAERDGYASLRLWPAQYPDFALEVRHDAAEGTSYWQTGSALQLVSRGRALGLLRLFAGTLEGAA